MISSARATRSFTSSRRAETARPGSRVGLTPPRQPVPRLARVQSHPSRSASWGRKQRPSLEAATSSTSRVRTNPGVIAKTSTPEPPVRLPASRSAEEPPLSQRRRRSGRGWADRGVARDVHDPRRRRAGIPGRTAALQRNVPFRLTSRSLHHASGSPSATARPGARSRRC